MHSLRLCLFGVLLLASAGAQQYPILPITAPNAPQGCMFPFEDHRGGLWLAGCEAGFEGLFYFDGTRFLSPVREPFRGGFVRGLVEDSDGGIWIAASEGIYRFYQGQLQKKFSGVALAGISQIAPDVFLATLAQSSGDPLHHAALMRISRVKGDWQAAAIREPVEQVQYRLDHAGHVLYGCSGGYCELLAEQIVDWKPGLSLTTTRHELQTAINYAENASLVWRDRLGCVWLRLTSAATYQCPADSKSTDLPATLVNLGFPSVFELADGTMGIPSYGRLILGRPGHFKVFNASNGFPNAVVVRPSRDESLWITTTSGLFVFPTHLKMEFWSARDGLSGTVWSILREGKDMLAVSDISTVRLDGDRTHWRPLPGPAGHLYLGPNNTVLVPNSSGVFQMSPAWKILRRSPALPVWLLAQDRKGSVWASGTGLYRLETRGREFVVQTVAPAQQFIQGLRFDRQGDLWTCSTAGLSQLHQSEWRAITTKDGLLQNECGAMTEDALGDIWYAYNTLPSFALIHNPRSARPAIQTFTNDGARNRTYFFASDQRGWLWRGTPDGVYAADPQQARQGQWLHLDHADGLPAVDTNQHSFFQDADGSIWFGAENSVIHLSPPDDFLHPGYAPSVFVSAFSSNGQAPEMADFVNEIKCGTDLVISIGSLQFDRRNAMRVRYRLLPEQASWTLQRDLNLHLGKLHAGSHTLEVQAQLGSGPWSAATVRSFTVLQPIWLSWPAISGLALAGGLGAAEAYRRRRKRAARSAKILPSMGEWRLAALSPEILPLAGTVLDSRFEVGPVLARGGFATIAKGRDLRQKGQACAIKIFRQELMEKDWINWRFQQEVRALEKIVHPNVVQIVGHGTTPAASPYLVMEFIEGQTLREKLEQGSLTPEQTASYLRQCGSALEVIHGHSICHRDLKPENLMIRTAGPAGLGLVLIDFSIAIVQDPDATLHGLSRAAGTFYYMAPEQSIGYADSSTDIYSLAKIVIEMLTGQRLSALLPNASMDLPDRVRELLSELSLGLTSSSIELISSALEFDPARRPKSAGIFASQIAADLKSEAVKD